MAVVKYVRVTASTLGVMPAGSAQKYETPELTAAKGVARKIDDLGRLVIPSEYRKVLGIKLGDYLDMTLEGNALVLKRLESSCVFCASMDDLTTFRSRTVCKPCTSDLTKQQGNQQQGNQQQGAQQ